MRRYPRLRDRSIFVGNPDDLVDLPLGPGLPSVRDWTLERYTCTGYVTGFTPPGDREALRAELGYRPGERVCLVTVGGSGVGEHLLRRVASAFPLAEKTVPGLRMIAVTGPRIDPASVPVPARRRSARLRPRPVPAPGRLRPGGGPGRADHDHGTGSGAQAVHLRAAGPPFRAADPRGPPAGAVPRRDGAWTTPPSTPSTSPKPSSPRSTARSTTARWRPTGRPGPRTCWLSCCSRYDPAFPTIIRSRAGSWPP